MWDEAPDGSPLTCTLLSSKLGLPLGPAQQTLDAVEAWFIPKHPVYLRRVARFDTALLLMLAQDIACQSRVGHCGCLEL